MERAQRGEWEKGKGEARGGERGVMWFKTIALSQKLGLMWVNSIEMGLLVGYISYFMIRMQLILPRCSQTIHPTSRHNFREGCQEYAMGVFV